LTVSRGVASSPHVLFFLKVADVHKYSSYWFIAIRKPLFLPEMFFFL
jgi:hypothetical protein